jgi:hypothetical protein
MTSFAVAADSCHVHSSSPLTTADQMHGMGYSESEMETDTTDLELETDATAFELETDTIALELETDATTLELETDASQEILKQERYSVD